MASQAFLTAEAAAATSSVAAASAATCAGSSHSPFSVRSNAAASANAAASSSSSRGPRRGSRFPSSATPATSHDGQDQWGPAVQRVYVRGDTRASAASCSGLSIGHDHAYGPAVLTNDFCGRRSTRQVSKLHFGRPRLHNGKHSPDAKVALRAVLNVSSCRTIVDVLDGMCDKLYLQEDCAYILRELGNAGEGDKALASYEWAINQEALRGEWCKLLSITISTLGRLGKVDLAQDTFDKAVQLGFGKNVYAYSALVSAYGRSGRCSKALEIFELMKMEGCKPNLVTYNTMIDACGKGGVDFKKALDIFEEMLREGVEPDRITFNSLISVCSKGDLWEEAQKIIEEMQRRGIEQDIFTLNTVVDAVCKAGNMDQAAAIVSSMRNNAIKPNVVTYSTLLDGYGKAGRFVEAIAVYEEMKDANIVPDRVSYNTLVYIYAKLGRFDDALLVCNQMEKAGWKKDAVTYNALLDAYGKQGKYQEAFHLFETMKAERIVPSVLTYSTLIDAYAKGGYHKEALHVFKEFKRAGLKADVVLYSALIDALCKSGLVDEATALLDEMIREGIRPNVVTYNSIIDAHGRRGQTEMPQKQLKAGTSSSGATKRAGSRRSSNVKTHDFSELSLKDAREPSSSSSSAYLKAPHKDILAAVSVFQEMRKLGVKPNVVTFSAILHACSRCASFTEATVVLEELRKFDSKVYGVAHGLLMGIKNQVWKRAENLFDEVARMDQGTAAAFYNALADVLWHFGQREGAQKVVLEARRRHVWDHSWQIFQHEYCLDLHLMSVGAAQAMLHAWLLNIRSIVFEGYELPKLLSILTGWGRHSKVAGESIVKQAVEAHLLEIGSPFRVAKYNDGRFTSTGPVVGGWLQEASTLERLVLHDVRVHPSEATDDCTERKLVPA